MKGNMYLTTAVINVCIEYIESLSAVSNNSTINLKIL